MSREKPLSWGTIVSMRLALPALIALALALAAPASASVKWELASSANSSAAPGQSLTFFATTNNGGDTPTASGSPVELKVTLPAAMTLSSLQSLPGSGPSYTCPGATPGSTSFTCTSSEAIEPSAFGPVGLPYLMFTVAVSADPAVEGVRSVHYRLSGGGPGATAAELDDPTQISAAGLDFGIDGFDGQISDADGGAFDLAAGHPDSISTEIDFNSGADPIHGSLWPIEPLKDVIVDLPPGLIGNPNAAEKCTVEELSNSSQFVAQPLCPPGSQIGTTVLSISYGLLGASQIVGPISVFNMVPPPGTPARFAFNLTGTVVILDARLRSGSDYGVSIDVANSPEALAILGSHVTFWGVPSAPVHDPLRSCPGANPPSAGGPSCAVSDPPLVSFLRSPTSCQAPADSPVSDGLLTTLHADSWRQPGSRLPDGSPDLSDPAWKSSEFVSHQPPGYPASPKDPLTPWGPPLLPGHCDQVPFTPSVSVSPTTDRADSPSGLEVDLAIPQGDLSDPAAISQSDLRDAVLTLPEGMRISAAAAEGLAGCSSAQIDLDEAVQPSCPDASKIGTVSIDTPLLDDPLQGAVYLGAQGDNPFHGLLAIYLVASGHGVVIKLAGRIEADPGTGRLTTRFQSNPQLPFELLSLHLNGGSRAPLITPARCGVYSVQTDLTPWSAEAGEPPAGLRSSFQIAAGPNGVPCPTEAFDPHLSAGTQNPLGGAFSPFNLRLSREDGTQELAGLNATLPPGLIGRLAGVPYCPDATLASISGDEGTGQAQIASPSCPAASQVGTVTVGAGAGPNPFYTTSGRAYLAGPYKGAPLSLAVVTPAVAGPFDLGNVVVRNALRIDPETTQVTAVSDSLPTILHGIPLDLRDIRVNLDKPDFTLNPTSCDPMAINATINGVGGGTANLSNRFQVSSCANLAFKPKLFLRLKGGTKRSRYPALRAELKARAGDANIGRVSVALPHSEFLAQSHIRTICTRVQYAASACPKGSVYGRASAWSPLLDQPLTGPVYLRSSANPLPDLVIALKGQIDVDLVGRIDSVKGGIRTTFDTVPDAPVSKFVLSMAGGKKGLLENSRDICKAKNKANVLVDGQNGKTADQKPLLKADCGKARKAKKHKKSGKR